MWDRTFLTSASVAVALLASVVGAQTRNYDKSTRAADTQTRPPTDEKDRAKRGHEDTDRWLRDFDRRYGELFKYENDFPSREVNLVPPAMANAAATRAEQRRSYSELNRTIRWQVDDFQNAPEMRKAAQEQDEAYADYLAARQRVLDTLAEDPSYRAAVELRDEMGQNLTALHAAPKKDEDNIVAVASVKLTHASVARDLEIAALAGDVEVRESRDRLIDATARILELRADFQRSLRSDPGVQAARNAHEDARIARLAAEAYLEGTVEAARAAVDYTYYIRRYDRYRYYGNVYGPYDYYRYRY